MSDNGDSRLKRSKISDIFMSKTKRILLLLCILIMFKYLQKSFYDVHIDLHVKYNKDWDNLVIALKTGKSTILRRVPIQMATFLSDVRNLVIFGDEDAVMGELQMINIINNSSYARSVDELRRIVGKDSYKDPNQEIIPDKQSMGWMMDAHKNLPAFEYLSVHYPSAQWYLMIDDDTFVFKRNLEKFIMGLNSSQSYYIGTPYTFKGCGIPKGESGPLFAQGELIN